MYIFMPPCHCNSDDLRDDLCCLCLASCSGFTVLNSFIALSVPLPSSVRTSRLHDWHLCSMPPIRCYDIVSFGSFVDHYMQNTMCNCAWPFP